MRHGWLPPFLISIACSVDPRPVCQPRKTRSLLRKRRLRTFTKTMAAGALSSEKLVQLYLARIAAYDRAGPRLNSIIYINPNAKAEAAALDKERADKGTRGPLHGIPVLLKDNIDVAGVPTTNRSAVMKEAIPSEDGSFTRALRTAGAVILARQQWVNSRAVATIRCAVRPSIPITSSARLAAQAAARARRSQRISAFWRLVPTPAPVRGPASYTGIVGLRPTTGLISRAGIAPKNLNFDSAGPMARNVTDLALMMNVLAFSDPKDPKNIEVWREIERLDPTAKSTVDFTKALDRDALRGKRLGVLRDLFEGDPEINMLAEQAIATMKELGATIVDIRLDDAFIEAHLKSGIRKTRALSDYRFRQDWEQYLSEVQQSESTEDSCGIYQGVRTEDQCRRLCRSKTV